MSAAVSLGRETLPADSLLHIPLVRMMLNDPCVGFRLRGVDDRWRYRGMLGSSLAGFNPALGAVFVGARSRLAQWLDDPAQGVRDLNESDALMGEVLFAVHDYLHVWAYRLVREAVPRLSFGRPPASADDVEDHVFCHLLTEAVATVGLDYWYLCTLDVNDVVDVGTTQRTLTVPYHDRDLDEHRRACPSLDPHDVSFFEHIVDVYASGVFRGFKNRDVRRSPLTLEWMRKELDYGALQRSYARAWLSFIGGHALEGGARELARPCRADEGWKRRLVTDLGSLLWEKVKLGRTHALARDRDPLDDAYDRVPSSGTLDFRFVNLRRVDLADQVNLARLDPRPERMKLFLRQYVAAHAFDDALDADVVTRAIDAADLPLVRALCRGLEPLDAEDDAPALLFFPS